METALFEKAGVVWISRWSRTASTYILRRKGIG